MAVPLSITTVGAFDTHKIIANTHMECELLRRVASRERIDQCSRNRSSELSPIRCGKCSHQPVSPNKNSLAHIDDRICNIQRCLPLSIQSLLHTISISPLSRISYRHFDGAFLLESRSSNFHHLERLISFLDAPPNSHPILSRFQGYHIGSGIDRFTPEVADLRFRIYHFVSTEVTFQSVSTLSQKDNHEDASLKMIPNLLTGGGL